MALLIPRWQVAWKWSVEQTQAVSTWALFDCPEAQPVHVVEHLQSKIDAVQSCCWVTGRQSVETKKWGSCVSNSSPASQKFACFENVKVSVFLCVLAETSMFRVMFTICKVLACILEGWIFPVEITLVAQVWKTLAFVVFLKILFSHCICVCSSCLQWDVSLEALWINQSIHPVSNMENIPIIFLPMSVGLNHEHPCQLAQSFWPKQDCLQE